MTTFILLLKISDICGWLLRLWTCCSRADAQSVMRTAEEEGSYL